MLTPPVGLEDVVRMTTNTSGQVIGRIPKLGTLQIGAPGDVAIMQLVQGSFTFNDTMGHTLSASQKLIPIKAVKAGALVGRTAGLNYRTCPARPLFSGRRDPGEKGIEQDIEAQEAGEEGLTLLAGGRLASEPTFVALHRCTEGLFEYELTDAHSCS